jgi:hypothetical protein
VQLGATAEKLAKEGIQTLGVVASTLERARLFFRYRPPRMPVGADPDLTTHRAFGAPNSAITPEIWQAVQSSAVDLLSERGHPGVPLEEAYDRVGKLIDGFQLTAEDQAQMVRNQAQLTGQFLIDREGIVRWTNIECARDGLAGLDRMPSEEELLAAARAL